MEQMLSSGRVRAIGVSNFQPHHLDRLREESDVILAVNQVETMGPDPDEFNMIP